MVYFKEFNKKWKKKQEVHKSLEPEQNSNGRVGSMGVDVMIRQVVTSNEVLKYWGG